MQDFTAHFYDVLFDFLYGGKAEGQQNTQVEVMQEIKPSERCTVSDRD